MNNGFNISTGCKLKKYRSNHLLAPYNKKKKKRKKKKKKKEDNDYFKYKTKD